MSISHIELGWVLVPTAVLENIRPKALGRVHRKVLPRSEELLALDCKLLLSDLTYLKRRPGKILNCFQVI